MIIFQPWKWKQCKLAQNVHVGFGPVRRCQRDAGVHGAQFHVGWMRSGEPPIQTSQTSRIVFAGSAFSGYFYGPAVCAPGRTAKVSLGSCVFTHPEATEATPSRHWHGARHLRVAISKVAGLGRRPQCLSWLSAVWPHIGSGGGHLLAGACNVFRSTEFWQHHSIWCRKMSAANESQQCLSTWTTTWKALCNWDAINISKLSLHKLSVFIFPILQQNNL